MLKNKTMALCGVVLASTLHTSIAKALCWGANGGEHLMHFSIINGLATNPAPEIIFNLPGDRLGDGNNYVSSNVLNRGGVNTLPNHVRFRLHVTERTTRSIVLQADSSDPLSCTTCTSSVTMPFSALGWTVNRATESTGLTVANGRFNNGQQTWMVSPPKTESIVNLEFDFLNSKVYPAGVYKGEFKTIGRAQ
ncbi:MAG: hypothetical protein QJT81_01665 [Candidatus Thiothrix putei]|uniref:Uncharacterized protein n=1 Tax=Candidatus Thiothrix putei TaxID=3080811 RepID=A0AA95KJR6_9GAMM|nr:MAG: hypothetical protein QJT81_01665 [Candidatus Thiothrix putei]